MSNPRVHPSNPPQSPVSVTHAPATETFIVIMAGGRGERFWPISREHTPKQLIRLLGEHSFLQEAVQRVEPLAPADHILIVTNTAQVDEVRRQLPQLPPDNIIGEPMGRDTCAAVALGAAWVAARCPSAVMAILPADHVIPDQESFRAVLRDSLALAHQTPAIVTIGIQPTEPATGYGYIQVGEHMSVGEGIASGGTRFSHVERFVEKPNLEVASRYLSQGGYLWNAGMFVWSIPTLLNGLQKHQPEMHAACLRWTDAARQGSDVLHERLAADYPVITRISIDYALLEKAESVVVADGTFAWDDLGAWPALARHVPGDSHGNAILADVACVDARRNIVVDRRTQGKTPIGLVGMEDTIVVLTDDAVLVASKSDSQKIKALVQLLAQDPARRHLI